MKLKHSLLMLGGLLLVSIACAYYIHQQGILLRGTTVAENIEVLPGSDEVELGEEETVNPDITEPVLENNNPPVLVTDPPPVDTTPQNPEAETISGLLTNVNTGCFSDGECSVTIDDKKIVVMIGWYSGPAGHLIGVDGVGDFEKYIGDKVSALVVKNSDGVYTILGDKNLYVKLETDTRYVAPECAVGGCSGQICGEKGEADNMVTNCMWTEAYACYQSARCEKQTSGQCGWTETDDLKMCLMNNGGKTQ